MKTNMGAIAKKPNKKNKNKKVNQNLSKIKSEQKNDQPKKHANKKPLKFIKRNNVNNEVQVSKTTKVLAKKIQQRNKNNAKSTAADLLNLNVANVCAPTKVQNGKANKSYTAPREKSENIPLTKSQSTKVKKQKRIAKWKNENNLENLKSVNNRKQKQGKPGKGKSTDKVHTENNAVKGVTKVPRLNVKRLEEMLSIKEQNTKKERHIVQTESLRERMMSKLRASRFRYLNETLYNNESTASKKYFKEDPDAFKAYHDGYKQQIEQWPLNPLDTIISSIKKMPKDHIIADFGCGEARLASTASQKVHSFDFVSLNEKVTACDMAHTPLLTGGVHVVVFCLSLMGTNLGDYLMEANRVLKKDGVLKVAEVESRFGKVEDFINLLSEYGFKNTWTDLSHNLFYFLDFKKEKDIAGKRNKLPSVTLKPCLYKKR